MDSFELHIKNIRAAMKSRDYYIIQTEFAELQNAMIKHKAVLSKGIPRLLVRILVDLEDYIKERLTDKEQFKTLSARQGRALNRMKLTLSKHNKAYQLVMAEYRKNPVTEEADEEDDEDDSDDSSSDSDDDDSDDDDDSEPAKKPAAAAASAKETTETKKKAVVSDSDSDESENESDSVSLDYYLRL